MLKTFSLFSIFIFSFRFSAGGHKKLESSIRLKVRRLGFHRVKFEIFPAHESHHVEMVASARNNEFA